MPGIVYPSTLSRTLPQTPHCPTLLLHLPILPNLHCTFVPSIVFLCRPIHTSYLALLPSFHCTIITHIPTFAPPSSLCPSPIRLPSSPLFHQQAISLLLSASIRPLTFFPAATSAPHSIACLRGAHSDNDSTKPFIHCTCELHSRAQRHR